MDWKREAEDKLRSYGARKASVGQTAEQIRLLEMQACSIRSSTADGTPVQGGGNGREDALISNLAQREELARARENTLRWLALVDGALGDLTDEERLILERFYIHRQRGAAERLMEELNIEKSHVYRKKDAALRRFTLLLYGWTET
ncbi:MAG: hypothetical protein LIO45_00940 [Clostridiales bacterium]|nr:hypothetical protein [Clostridiales bacterium]